MGHIRERPRGSGSRQIIYDLPRTADGKRVQKSKTIHGTKTQAKKELARIEQEIDLGTYCQPTKMNLADYLDKWLRDYAKLNVNPKTYEEYERIIKTNIVPSLGNIPLSKLRPLHLQEYYTEMCERGSKIGRGGLSKKTVLNHHVLLRNALNRAVEWMLIVSNPADRVKPPTPDRHEMNTIGDKDLGILLQAAEGTRLYIPILIAISTGMRRGEIVALTWADLDFENGSLRVDKAYGETKSGIFLKPPKTRSGNRSIALPATVIDLLRNHKREQAKLRLRIGPDYQNHDLICPLDDGSPYPPDRLSRHFADFVAGLGMPHITYHELRHSLATMLTNKKVNPKITSERLGHSDVRFTMFQYVHSTPEIQREAAELIDDYLQNALHQAQEGY